MSPCSGDVNPAGVEGLPANPSQAIYDFGYNYRNKLQILFKSNEFSHTKISFVF